MCTSTLLLPQLTLTLTTSTSLIVQTAAQNLCIYVQNAKTQLLAYNDTSTLQQKKYLSTLQG